MDKPPGPVLRKVRTDEETDIERAIRDEVFIKEQSVPFDLEFENEEISSHYLLWVGNKAVGCGRCRPTDEGIKLERVAVLSRERGKGYGKIIVKGLLDEVLGHHPIMVYLNSQTSVREFYERCGFRAAGDIFMEAGIPHIRMVHYRKEGA